jgi:hypothetical protein
LEDDDDDALPPQPAVPFPPLRAAPPQPAVMRPPPAPAAVSVATPSPSHMPTTPPTARGTGRGRGRGREIPPELLAQFDMGPGVSPPGLLPGGAVTASMGGARVRPGPGGPPGLGWVPAAGTTAPPTPPLAAGVRPTAPWLVCACIDGVLMPCVCCWGDGGRQRGRPVADPLWSTAPAPMAVPVSPYFHPEDATDDYNVGLSLADEERRFHLPKSAAESAAAAAKAAAATARGASVSTDGILAPTELWDPPAEAAPSNKASLMDKVRAHRAKANGPQHVLTHDDRCGSGVLRLLLLLLLLLLPLLELAQGRRRLHPQRRPRPRRPARAA